MKTTFEKKIHGYLDTTQQQQQLHYYNPNTTTPLLHSQHTVIVWHKKRLSLSLRVVSLFYGFMNQHNKCGMYVKVND